MSDVKKRCHEIRNEIHRDLKSLQVLTTKIKKLETLKTLHEEIEKLKTSIKTQIIKDLENDL
jgi:hypothetical protein